MLTWERWDRITFDEAAKRVRPSSDPDEVVVDYLRSIGVRPEAMEVKFNRDGIVTSQLRFAPETDFRLQPAGTPSRPLLAMTPKNLNGIAENITAFGSLFMDQLPRQSDRKRPVGDSA
jgi:hypothetical protein